MTTKERIEQATQQEVTKSVRQGEFGAWNVTRPFSVVELAIAHAAAREAFLIAKERITSWQFDEDDEGTEIAICGYCYESGVIHKWDCPIAIIEKLIDDELTDGNQGATPSSGNNRGSAAPK